MGRYGACFVDVKDEGEIDQFVYLVDNVDTLTYHVDTVGQPFLQESYLAFFEVFEGAIGGGDTFHAAEPHAEPTIVFSEVSTNLFI